MSLRTGILSDSHFKKNCLDYQAPRIGVFNADFAGDTMNPFFDGIKTPKYQRSAPKPQSLDVLAVNQAALYKGNRQKIARDILQQEQTSAREFKPPPIKLRTVEQQNDENFDYAIRAGLNIFDDIEGIRKSTEEASRVEQQTMKRMIATNRGTQMTKQTISTQTQNIQKYLLSFMNKSPDEQKTLLNVFGNQLIRQGVNVREYNLELTGTEVGKTDRRTRIVERLLEIANARGANIDLEDMFNPLGRLPLPTGMGSTSTASQAGTSVGTSTQASIAPTVEGTPETSTSATTTETEKK
jgi:hypothetical protein